MYKSDRLLAINDTSTPIRSEVTELRSLLALLAVAGFVSGSAIRIAEPMLPKLATEFSVTAAAAGSVITWFALAYGGFQLVHGPIGDRLGKLRTIAGALLLAGIASCACAAATSIESLALYRFAVGMTAGAVIPLSFAYIGDNIPFESRQAMLGRFIGGILLGQTSGPLLGGFFSDWIGWRYTFLVPGVAFMMIGSLLAHASRGERVVADRARSSVLRVYLTLFRQPLVQAMCAFVAIESFVFSGLFAYFGVYMHEAFGFSFTIIGLCLAGFGVGGVAYSMSVKFLMVRLGQTGIVRTGGVLLLFAHLILGFVAHPWLMFPLIVIIGFGFLMLHNTMQTYATEMAPGARGAGVALFAFALFFAQAIGVNMVGEFIDSELMQSTGFAPLFCTVGVALVLLAWTFARWIARRAS